MRLAGPAFLGAAVLALSGCSTLPSLAAVSPDPAWRSLFNGSDLAGWRRVNGSAPFVARDGAIVGAMAAGSPNSFLVTEQVFDDFIFEAEVKAASPFNSGIGFRNVPAPQLSFSGLRGYQLEIDLSPRAWTGGVYVEGDNRFLQPMDRNPACRQAFVSGAWNALRIEAIGSSLRTWVNGVACADLADPTFGKGFIALQVHAISGPMMPAQRPELAGSEVAWRDIRILTEGLAAELRPGDDSVPHESYLVNVLTARERRDGWRLMFDGRTLDGWIIAGDASTGPTPRIMDGAIELAPGQALVSPSLPDAFEIAFDVRPGARGEGGVAYLTSAAGNDGEPLEFRIFDDASATSGEPARGAQLMGALGGRLTATNLSEPGRTKRYNGPNAWARGRIVVRDGKVEHWLNAVKVVEYRLADIAPDATVRNSPIVLAAEVGVLAFRSLKVRPLDQARQQRLIDTCEGAEPGCGGARRVGKDRQERQ